MWHELHGFFSHIHVSLASYFTYIIAGAVAPVAFCLLQGQYFEGGQWGGAWLGRDHPSEPGYRPCANMIVVCTHWNRETTNAGDFKPSCETEIYWLRCQQSAFCLLLCYPSHILLPDTPSSPDTRCFSDSIIFVTELLWTVKVWKSWGPDPTVSGCCTMTLTAPLLVP